MQTRRLIGCIVLLAGSGLCAVAPAVMAHKPVTSKYTYYEHIQPLFRFYCGGCHRPDGIAPMSLLSYQDAYPWAESIKEQLLADSMHPWQDDETFGRFTHDRRLTPRQLDMIVDWAGGGTPAGALPADTLRLDPPDGWPLGAPDVTLTMPAPVTLGAGETEKTVTATFPVDLPGEAFLAAFDMRPGCPEIVHDAVLYVAEQEPHRPPVALSDLPANQILGVWVPGLPRLMADPDAGYRIPAKTRIALRLHYRKSWREEGNSLTDSSVIGLYFSPAPTPKPIKTMTFRRTGDGQNIVAIDQLLDRSIRLSGIMPGLSGEGAAFEASAVLPDGRRIDLLRVAGYSSAWPMRYEFRETLFLPRGSRLRLSANYASADASPPASPKMTVWVDYVE